jgi:hypothetical protein
VAAGAAPELDDLRAACDEAVAGLLAARPDRLITVGSGSRTFGVDGAAGSFAPYGVRVPVASFGPRDHAAVSGLPLSLTVGAWLLERARRAEATGRRAEATGRRAEAVARRAEAACVGQSVAATLPSPECAALGAELGASAERVALLVMGDGSACRGDRAPGYADPRAEPYDDAVAAALRDADPPALLALDEKLSGELMVAGRPAWQVLAGAALAGHRTWHGALSYASAPYGVCYFVATWRPA